MTNGLIERRGFLRSSLAGVGVLAAAPAATRATQAAAPNVATRFPGAAMSEYGAPSPHAAGIVRQRIRSAPGTTGAGASATPLQHLRGTITPAGLHFERHHSGVPEINPEHHVLSIHGEVDRPLAFSVDALHRYPMTTRTYFLECSGNSAPLLSAKPLAWNCADIHGLVSCSEWTGVPLSTLLDDVGVQQTARWVIAGGADAGRMNRSVPLAKCQDDALVALYQNGEPLRPENGYPLRLFLPGYEGNMSVKWLQRLELRSLPAMSREETSKYTDLAEDGSARGFTFDMGVKSVITSPSPGLTLQDRGIYQITGLAWSGKGVVSRVEVSADGGKTWVDAEIAASEPKFALRRFSAAWNWQGQPGVLLSRATNSLGEVQPTRSDWLRSRGRSSFYHYNAIQAWQVKPAGTVHNHYVV